MIGRWMALWCVAVCTAAVPATGVMAQGVEMDASLEEPLLRVSGEGTVEVEPDRVTLGLGVTASGETAAEAQAAASGAVERVLTAVRGVGARGLLVQTSQISVSPRYDNRRNRNEPPAIVGYEASQRVSVRLDEIDKAGAVLDQATAAGANQNFGVTFGLQDRDASEDAALKDAVEDAQRRAAAIAGALGKEIAGVVSVESAPAQGGFAPVGISRNMAVSDAPPPSTSVEGGRLTVRASVVISYRLR